MRLKSIVGTLAAIVFAFAVVACNDDPEPTEAPTEAPAATAEAEA